MEVFRERILKIALFRILSATALINTVIIAASVFTELNYSLLKKDNQFQAMWDIPDNRRPVITFYIKNIKKD